MTYQPYIVEGPHGVCLVLRDEDENGMGRNKMSVYVDFSSHFGQPAEAQINWSALGSVDIDTATEYAVMLECACEVARQFRDGSRANPETVTWTKLDSWT